MHSFLTYPLLISLTLFAAPAFAERTMTADEFAQMVTGKTLYFNRFGEAFGAEQYFDDKRVIWAFEDGQCQRGIWFENAAGEICFIYDNDPGSQCWNFLEGDGGEYRARLSGADPSQDLVTRKIGNDALDCPLPDLGV